MAELSIAKGGKDAFHAQAETIIGAYHEIGLANDRTHDVLVEKAADELAKLAAIVGDLEYEPYVVPSAIRSDLDFWELLGQYDPTLADRVQSGRGGFVFRGLWDQYSNPELSTPPTARSFVSGMLLGGNNSVDRGLHANGLRGSERQNAIHGLKMKGGEHVLIEPMEPAAWLALNAIRRYKGEPLLGGFTHFDLLAKEPHPKSTEGTLVEPYANINAKRMLLGSATVEGLVYQYDPDGRMYASPRGPWGAGIRLVVSQGLSHESVPARLPQTGSELEASAQIDELTHQAA